MDYKEIIGQLQCLKEHEELWQDYIDMEALDEAMDIIYDYGQAAEHNQSMIDKYETTRDAINRGMGNWQCPTCHKFISYGNEHCHWCGQRLGWEPKSRPKQGGRKCRKR